MACAKQNKTIGRLIVAAMSVDGSLDKKERQKVAKTLQRLGMPELIAEVGAALDSDPGDINMYEECNELKESLGSRAEELAPLTFRIITDVVASDRFVSEQEATYLSSIARRLGISMDKARSIFREVMTEKGGRLQISGKDVDEILNPQLKGLLSFDGADDLVGELSEDSLAELMYQASEAIKEGASITFDEMERALAILGLPSSATAEDAEEVWKETIDKNQLSKMADLGETFVTATLQKLQRVNDAYKTILHFNESLEQAKEASAA